MTNSLLDQFTGDVFQHYLGIGVLIVIIQIVLVGIVYAVGKALDNSKMIAYSKEEMAQAIFSLLIIGGLFTLLMITNNTFCLTLGLIDSTYTSTCGQNLNFDTHLAIARLHLAQQYNNLRVLGVGILRIYDWKMTSSGMGLSMGLAKIKPFSYQIYDTFALKESFSYLIKVMLFLKYQEIFMLIGGYQLFPILLGLGLFFRAISITRKLGGLLIGIGLGLFYVLPYMYILSQVILQSNGCFSSKYLVDATPIQITGFTLGNMIESNGIEKDANELIKEHIKNIEDKKSKLENDPTKIKALAEAELVAESAYTDNGKGGLEYTTGNEKHFLNPGSLGVLPKGKLYFGDGLFSQNSGGFDPNNLGPAAANARKVDSVNIIGNSKPLNNYLNNRNIKYNSCGNIEPSILQIVAFHIIAATFTSIVSIVGMISAIKEISKLLGGDTEIAGITRVL